MKKILIPTDFSDNAFNAVRYALQLFAEETCTFTLLNSYNPPMAEQVNPMTTADTARVILDMAKKTSEDGLNEVLQKISADFPNKNHTFKTVSEYNFLKEAIEELVEAEKPDLIVMGTKGASGLKEIFLGSNTARVISQIECPLLAVPENATFSPIKEIAFATDYDYYFERSEMETMIDLINKFDAGFHVFHVLEHGEELPEVKAKVRNYLADIFKEQKPDFRLLTEAKLDTATRIFIQSRDVDLLCMVTRKQTFIERLFGKSRTGGISFHVQIPLLILRKEN
ncbi:universal stress protein [Ascidiimonas aurantiaca]|uniref:universal stress protein n=1 Tax=Ascidiimonas aurantiaca TaxID=1685432 RepID=UPI0030EB9144